MLLDFGETWLWGRVGWLSQEASWGLVGGGFARPALLGWGVVLGLLLLWRKGGRGTAQPVPLWYPTPLAVGAQASSGRTQ